MTLQFWFRSLWQRHGPRRKLIIVDGDTPPSPIRSRHIYLCRDDGDDWSIAMRCPCGCGDDLELMLLEEVSKHSARLVITHKSEARAGKFEGRALNDGNRLRFLCEHLMMR